MPKVDNTRKQRAAKLLERIERGPSHFVDTWTRKNYTAEDAEKYAKGVYQIWKDSWIVGEILSLIPELRSEKERRDNEYRARLRAFVDVVEE